MFLQNIFELLRAHRRAEVLKSLIMKTLKNSSKPIIVMFWSIPSCSTLKVYKEKCMKLNQAVSQKKPVKVVTNEDMTIQFNCIGVHSGTFFGIENIKGKISKINLNINAIKMITLL